MFPVVLISAILAAMENCILCKKNLYNGDPVFTIGERGSQGINNASKKREDRVLTSPGDTVHQQCRKTYCNPRLEVLCLKEAIRKSRSHQRLVPRLEMKQYLSLSKIDCSWKPPHGRHREYV